MSAITELRKLLRYRDGTWHYDGVSMPDDWNGCPMINPLCPDDLCWLPYAHPGFDKGVHFLGTDADAVKYDPEIMKLHPRGPNATEVDLVELGHKRQREMFPDHFSEEDQRWG